jgi:hypothetical protein
MIKVKPNKYQKGYSRNCKWIIDYFKGQNVYIVGGGPSLDGFDFSRLDNKKTITINHSYRHCKTDILVFLDGIFVREIKENFGHDIYKFPFKVVAGASTGIQERGNVTKIQYTKEICLKPDRMYGRPCSTFIAMSVALVAGARNIFLLGIDGKFKNGKGHFYTGGKFKHKRDNYEAAYRRMVPLFDKFKRFKNIYNCNKDSLIKTFTFIDIDSAIGMGK